MNEPIKKLLDDGEITQPEYDILFTSKENWKKGSSETISFNKLLTKIINAQFSTHKDLSYIQFPYFIFQDLNIGSQIDITISFKSAKFYDHANFQDLIFLRDINFQEAKFYGDVNFTESTFKESVNFSYASFKSNTDFSEVSFHGDTSFSYANFQKNITFENTECKGIFDFSDVSFESILLDKSSFTNASYLRLYGWNSKIHEDIAGERLSSKHFQTKESARIIKAYFEKENNIIESNIYYPIEMDKYREEISKYSNPFIAFIKDQDYLVTTLSKYVSNYNTSWLRVFFWILFLSLITLFFHDGLPSDKTTLLNIPNRAIELINPLNIFKKDYNLYKGHEFWAMIVRVITIYLFYQFTMAFRQNTRRK